jgi:hypothetical protein
VEHASTALEEETEAKIATVAENSMDESGLRHKPGRFWSIPDTLMPGQFTVCNPLWQQGKLAGEGKRGMSEQSRNDQATHIFLQWY